MSKVHISTGISKLGETIPTVSLPPILTCRHDAPCTKLCYATHGRFRFKNVKDALQRNLDIWQQDPDGFFNQIHCFLTAIPYRYFRWFSAGDIPDADFLRRMCRLAQQHTATSFLCFTKKYELINAYTEEHRIPSNLRIIFSRWGNFPCPNPHSFPEAWVKFKDEEICFPSNAIECSGFCGECVQNKHNCWKMRKGDAVWFHQH